MQEVMKSLEDPDVRELLRKEADAAGREDDLERQKRIFAKSLLSEATKSSGRPGKISRRRTLPGFA